MTAAILFIHARYFFAVKKRAEKMAGPRPAAQQDFYQLKAYQTRACRGFFVP
jgi:hypothetical protein